MKYNYKETLKYNALQCRECGRLMDRWRLMIEYASVPNKVNLHWVCSCGVEASETFIGNEPFVIKFTKENQILDVITYD